MFIWRKMARFGIALYRVAQQAGGVVAEFAMLDNFP